MPDAGLIASSLRDVSAGAVAGTWMAGSQISAVAPFCDQEQANQHLGEHYVTPGS
jgi:hypothetical protein